jgi:hypothetical protein
MFGLPLTSHPQPSREPIRAIRFVILKIPHERRDSR